MTTAAAVQSTLVESTRVLFTVNGKQLEFRLLIDSSADVIDVWVTDPAAGELWDSLVVGFTGDGQLRKYPTADKAFDAPAISGRIKTEK